MLKMDKQLKNTIEKGQRGTVAFLALSILFLLSPVLYKNSDYSMYFMCMVAVCFIAAGVWNMLFIRCPNCRKYVGEYMIFGPPIKVSKECQYCGYKLKEFD